MNTQEEIQQTFKDYQMGKNGFENAQQWESKIKLLAKGAKYEELWCRYFILKHESKHIFKGIFEFYESV